MRKNNHVKDTFFKDAIKKEEKLYHVASVSLLPRNPIIIVFLILCVITDFSCIYSLYDEAYSQMPILAILITVMFSSIIDIGASLLAGIVKKKIDWKSKKVYKYLSIVLAVTLFVFLGLFFVCRYSNNQLFYDNSTSIEKTGFEEYHTSSSGQKMSKEGKESVNIATCMLPIGTSVLSFVFSLLDGIGYVEVIKNKQRRELEESVLISKLRIAELKQQLEVNHEEYVDALSKLEFQINENQKKLALQEVRMKMARSLKNPEALTHFLESGDLSVERMEGEENNGRNTMAGI